MVGSRPVAFVDVPSLEVVPMTQTYLREAERRWTYSDPTYGTFALTVDGGGVVVDYEGLAIQV